MMLDMLEGECEEEEEEDTAEPTPAPANTANEDENVVAAVDRGSKEELAEPGEEGRPVPTVALSALCNCCC